jgi:serine/threonine protein kinase
MPVPATDEELLDLVRQSALVSPERLDEFVRANGPLPGRPRRLARMLVRAGLLTVFQANQLLHGHHRGFFLGKYRLLELLGRGGAGTVYLCEHTGMGRRVAVKVLSAAKTDEASLARFFREARAIATLDHPNLVRAHDLDQRGGVHFLVMEYVEGPNLQALVEQSGPLGLSRAAHYVRQAALGLQHLHEAGLVHRDVKPSNLLVDRNGTVKILDLGLARFREHRDGLTGEPDGVIGTADYLSPEQASNAGDVDIRGDIYSLGATFYFLLAGRPPFAGEAVHQKLVSHLVEEPTPICTLRPEVPDGLAAILATMMAKDRAQRYPIPAAIVEALAPWTRTPVPPPSADEMPQLCPAAGGTEPTSGAPKTTPSLSLPDMDRSTNADFAVESRDTTPLTAQAFPLGEQRSPETDPAVGPLATPTSLSLDEARSVLTRRRRGLTLLVVGATLLLAAALGAALRWAFAGP